MYLEVLVGGGIVAFAFLPSSRSASSHFANGIGPGQTRGRPGDRPAGPTYDSAAALGIAAAGLAIALHALVDSFLSFAPIYVLFALTLGVPSPCARGVETSADAHRV